MILNDDMQRRRRVMSLTPMIDVVFLLLVFFMLAARFDVTTTVEVTSSEGGSEYTGPPRLIDVGAQGLKLNGVAMSESEIFDGLSALMSSSADIVVLRAEAAADVQRLLDVMTSLRAQGFVSLRLVE